MGDKNLDETNLRVMRAKKGSPFLSTKEAAHYLHLNPYTLGRMRKHGTGPRYRRHGRNIFYHIDDLDAWSASRAR
ncbi:MAG: helix-turn-helix domain-containing protein [Alphaproteobacteria bacterium]|nr:helix-turn-helix domain-containing protein [Alphaproteobacteria bacterium]MDE2111792.1 helix-turn-helix domain-containing protein [Alphaproteobacteria bacterium]MDE2495433.1 helix-turn-helix domain-containing protein [Alphaproteobacteria bacterium]